MSAMSDEMYAKLFEKLVSGKVNEEEVVIFLQESLHRSPLYGEIENVPNVEIHHLERYMTGSYKPLVNAIFINQMLVEDVTRKKAGAICQILDAFGHECTHASLQGKACTHQQHTGGIGVLPAMKAQDFKDIVEFIYGADHKLTDNELVTLSYMSYYCRNDEVMARAGGRQYCIDVFSDLKKNKYIRGKLVRMIEIEEEFAKNEKDDDLLKQEYFERIKKLFGNVEIRHLIDRERELIKGNFGQLDLKFIGAIKDAIQLRYHFNQMNIAEDFCKVIFSDSFSVKNCLLDVIKDPSCPESEKYKIKEFLKRSLNKDNLAKKIFDMEWVGIFEADDYIEIYNKCFREMNYKNLNSELFERYVYEDDTASQMLGRVFIENCLKGMLK